LSTDRAGNVGTVVAVFGRRYEVEAPGGEHLDCVTRGKKHIAACGDRVEFATTGPGQGVIDKVLPRRNYLERSDAYKQKGIAANVDQVLVLAAVEPRASEEFITRVLLIAHAAGVPALIALNKTDVPGTDVARTRLSMFESAGYEIVELKAKPRDGTAPSAQEALLERVSGKCTVLVGQSGMGKSSLINALVPDAAAVIGELSAALKAGKHTTTFSRLYRIDPRSTIIDCPGMQEVGIHHLSHRDLEAGFHEFAPYLGSCRFANCRHAHEPDCPIRAHADSGQINRERLALFQKLATETGT
jgi:ribosome biogenesis GTPase